MGQATKRIFAKKSPSPKRWIVVAVGAIVLIALGLGVAVATDSSEFCNATCHEMKPYYTAWSAGPHKKSACITCHVDAGLPARLAHKWVALGELKTHVFGDPKFPLADPSGIPNYRCVACHKAVEVKRAGFSHAEHAKRGACQMCHITVGHNVTAAALKAEGVYSGIKPAELLIATNSVATVGMGVANLAGHKSITCSQCHDMQKTGCPSCHEAPAKHASGACQACHIPGPKFVFTHPMGDLVANCAECHKAPAADHAWKGTCADCHKKPGVSWKFSHPSSKATCTKCHTRPAKHKAGACSNCHKNTGKSWAFSHGSSSKCSSCHSAPANHFSGSCSGCHSPSRKWSSATFSHPGIRGGEHSYKSFACAKCHPNGYSSYSCLACHKSAAGPSED